MDKSYIIILTMLWVFKYDSAHSQKLVRNEKDEFTGHLIKETSWEPLLPMTMQNVHFRIRKINEFYFFDLKWMGGDLKNCSIGIGNDLMFKLSNEKIIALKNIEYTSTCLGCGAVGFAGSNALGIKATYSISKDDLINLTGKDITKLRLYTSEGYIEKEMKEKFSNNVMASLSLIN